LPPLLDTPRAGESAQQRDNLCGPFWAARVLRDFGVERWDGELIEEDLIALRAGSTLPDRPTEDSVPAGAESRTDYRYELPTTTPELSGTEAGALAGAIEAAAGGALRCLPLRGSWDADRVERLVDAASGVRARLLANVRTGPFWGSRPPLERLLAELEGREAEGPPADWDVGHFVELVMVLRGPAGSLVLVHDSYPTLGWNGRHLQPPRAVASALRRDDGRDGGVLAVASVENAEGVEALAGELGLELGIWDNGTRR
jgi:hypothetical protein